MVLDGQDPQAVRRAAEALAHGELVGMPTETVYGLAARADQDAAVAKIFAAKGRPSDHPLIVHVLDESAARVFAQDVPDVAHRLIQAFWPGPLTLIVRRAPGMAAAAAGGQDSVGLRCPSHPVARALLAQCRELGVEGLAAPSANRFGRVSPTLAQHVADEFDPGLLVLDGGACDVGIESTIVDCSRGRPVLLRPGVLTPEQIEAAAGVPLQAPDAQAPRASGTLAAHYAPRAVVRLMSTEALRAALKVQPSAADGKIGTDAVTTSPAAAGEAARPSGLAVYSRTALDVGDALYRPMPAQARAAARQLFAVLRELDAEGASEIWVETPPDEAAWDGVRDRLSRAAAAFVPR
ncbi:L-threonylcarbamoyladenylate synthase [Roseateles amylovorans]|uniref:Threonylcarbamoyl-AMP synthase n=1 Tax=Roseateles amylovorans TaxID=2978473 RepID=A0ABY6B0S9_9BURK|nr:L-threonylcarbamoyladenylate synthase [Roseateles amylovorans]UXH79006.1 L-threonylcarbamoyladenylate synthase [Roseateles amylovorans]